MSLTYIAPAFNAREDVEALLPIDYRRATDDTVREALVDSLYALFQSCQDSSDYAVAQSDATQAVGAEEDALFEDRGIPRAGGELDEPYRNRALGQRRVATFTAIRDAVDAILATVTTARCRLADLTMDRWFIGGTDAREWHSFIGAAPNYPDRLFEDNAPQNPEGVFIPGNSIGGPVPGTDTVGRLFLLRVPDLMGFGTASTVIIEPEPVYDYDGLFAGNGAASNVFGFVNANDPLRGWYAYIGEHEVLSGPTEETVIDYTGLSAIKLIPATSLDPDPEQHGFFVGDGSYSLSFASAGEYALSIYQAIVSTVNALAGHSIRWVMLSDNRIL